MLIGQLFHRLELHDNSAIDDEVEHVFAQRFAFVAYLNPLLGLEGHAAPSQLIFHPTLVDRFQKSRTELSMNFHGGTNDRVGRIAMNELGHPIFKSA